MRIAVINTGGTISCTGTPLAPMTAEAFAEASRRIVEPILQQEFPGLELDYVTDLRFPESAGGTLDSTNLQPRDWCLLAGRILADYDAYDGWVVLHGTDSMAYTGGALPFLLSAFDVHGTATVVLDKPVVVTGSQVPLFHQDSAADPLTLRFNTDAFQNVCAAVAIARTGIPEVAVAFRGSVFRGSRVLKTNASEDDAFSSPNFPALATMGIDLSLQARLVLPGPVDESVALSTPAVRTRAIERLEHIAARIDDTPVAPVPAFPAPFATGGAFLARIIDAIVAAGAKGLVLESYGEGNFPSGDPDDPGTGAIARALTAAGAAGVVVVNATQVLAGTVDDSAYAAGAWLPAAGAVGIGDMTPIAALVKTMVLLAEEGWSGNDWDAGAVRRLVRQSLIGEARVIDRLDARGRADLLPGESLAALDGSATFTNDPQHGPVLTAPGGQTLWSALSAAPGAALPALPGRVVADGATVTLVGRDGTTAWHVGAGAGASASATGPSAAEVWGLALRGSFADGSLALVATDRTGHVVTTLYPE